MSGSVWKRLLARLTSSCSVLVLKNSSDLDGLTGEPRMGAEDERCCCMASMMDEIMALSGVSTSRERAGVRGRSGRELSAATVDDDELPKILSASENTDRLWVPWRSRTTAVLDISVSGISKGSSKPCRVPASMFSLWFCLLFVVVFFFVVGWFLAFF